ncbi:tetratricopeptide repeat protein [Modestobacter sp. L9-4]|uniref:UDP-N-acetylglucosamine-peptide N-acetylglucosaminyltransferase n=1 Tax=Modestobacter sp. L9-4 TaxID=2851567 RepID=UPI001C79A4F8|nr:UDP-N-acetylglucosamine-peptide N-acetylglucosaminyltransferase [Modestobacter sp. L9-4]QXG74912.1 tetratricopeptide repeat protein [Modestobacter sp. L9-4]
MDDDLDQRFAALDGSDDVDALMDVGRDLTDAERYREAEQCFRRAAGSGSGAALFALAWSLAAQECWRDAALAFERAASAGEVDGWLHQGVCLEEVGDLAGARLAYERAAAVGDADGWVHQAWLSRLTGDHARATDALVAGVAAGSELAAAVQACWQWHATRDPVLEPALRAGAELYQDARADLAALLRQARRLQEAKAVLERGVELGETGSMLPLGNLLSDDLEDDDAAERVYRLGIAAGDVFCHNNLGVLLRDRGDVAGAAEQFMLGELSGDAKAAANLTALREDGP